MGKHKGLVRLLLRGSTPQHSDKCNVLSAVYPEPPPMCRARNTIDLLVAWELVLAQVVNMIP